MSIKYVIKLLKPISKKKLVKLKNFREIVIFQKKMSLRDIPAALYFSAKRKHQQERDAKIVSVFIQT
jgi:hypothetical protein